MTKNKPKLFIVTGTKFKFDELSFALREFFDCEQRNWDEPEIQGTSEEIIKHKVETAYQKYKCPVLVDDVSVSIEELGGFPGPYMKDFFEHMTPFEMGNKFVGSKISASCRLGLCREEGDVVIAEGKFHGKIIKPKDNDHKGRFFEIFVQLEGTDRPMLEYSIEEKNKISHRGRAMQNLLEILGQENKTSKI